MNCKKSEFRLDPSVTYLNCSFMAPQLSVVEDAGLEGIRYKRNPHQITIEHFFNETENLRSEYAKLIGAKNPQRIVVVPSVSYGMANVAKNLPLQQGNQLIVAGEQFPSNVYPWRRAASDKGAEIITVPAPDVNTDRGKTWNERVLDAISPKTKMVAVGNVHWADGTLFNLKEIRKRTREVGAWLVIDGTQSVGALPFSIEEIQPDALICAGYKWLLGPYSMGLAYYGPALDDGIPVEENWINRYDSENFAGLVNYNNQYQPYALRYEVGEHSNFILIPMQLAAIKQLNSWGVENIQAYCDELISDIIAPIRERGFGIEDEEFRGSHLLGIRLGSEHDLQKIQGRMKDENILVSFRGNSIRVSPNVYNTKEDLVRFSEVLLSSA